jgi:hypothetical protein
MLTDYRLNLFSSALYDHGSQSDGVEPMLCFLWRRKIAVDQ